MTSRMWWWAFAAVVLLIAAGCATLSNHAPAAPSVPVSVSYAPRVLSAAEAPKDGPCIQTTHGCIALNPDVIQETVDQTICVSSYTKSVRPSSSYTREVKAKFLRKEGIEASKMSDYELDHIVPLALGGHPRKLSNLELQLWEGEHGAKRKDALEVRMQILVCRGQVLLTEAQACIAEDWEACAARYTGR